MRWLHGFVIAAALAVACASARAEPASGGPVLADRTALVDRLYTLADERRALMPAVAARKWLQDRPIADPPREAAVIAAATDRAGALGLAPAPVTDFFALQIRLARDTQSALHDHWRSAGFDAPPAPASLAGELRPRLDRLTQELLEALYLAAPFLAEADPALLEERARLQLPSERWSDGERRELAAAIAQVRIVAPRSPARAKAAGVLRIGTPADYAPFSLWAEGRLSGVDVELASTLAAALGLRPVFIQTTWKSLMADLATDHFDIAAGGISITPARAAVAAFSQPTAHGGKTAIGRCRERDRFGSLAAIDRAEVRVVENPGGTNERFARQMLHNAGVRIHPDNRTIFEELQAGRADVMFTDDTEIALVTRRMPELCRLLETIYEPADKAFLLPAGGDWTVVVDGWLVPELGRGTPARLLDRYLGR